MYSTRAGMQSLKRGAAVRALHMDRRLTRAFTRSLATIPIPMVHNSLNAISEELTKERPGSWHWYSCGPTVYDDAHLGHARTYVCTDIIRRVLEDVFHQHITLALGITDIDDKIIQRAKERKLVGVQAVQSMVRQLEHEFFVDMAKLNVLPPSAVLRVSEHIPDIIAYIQGIVEAGFAYHSPEHGVYFDVPKFGNRYGKLMHAVSTQENDQADNDTSAKKDIRDFALWKCAKAGEPSWASPWGNGRPGWHIECSAMTHNLFGRDVDIHSGGIDLKFPHHNNEIAQCEAFHNCDTWVRYWVHTGHLHIRGRKMSKSLKNFITVKDFFAEAHSPALQQQLADNFRLFCLSHKYNATVSFSEDRIREGNSLRERFTSFLQMTAAASRAQTRAITEQRPHRPTTASRALSAVIQATHEQVLRSLAQDFDTPAVLDAMISLVSKTQQYVEHAKSSLEEPLQPALSSAVLVQRYLRAFGLRFAETSNTQSTTLAPEVQDTEAEIVLDVLSDFRAKIRRAALELKREHHDSTGGSKQDPRGQFLSLCDEVREICREEALVQLLDSKLGGGMWVRISEASTGAETQTRVERQPRYSTTLSEIPLGTLFMQGEYAGHYTHYDDQGIPTHDMAGKELSTNQRKKLEKKYAKHVLSVQRHSVTHSA